jgi:hypothetical protein
MKRNESSIELKKIVTQETTMNKRTLTLTASGAGLLATAILGSQIGSTQEQDVPGAGFAAIPGQ